MNDDTNGGEGGKLRMILFAASPMILQWISVDDFAQSQISGSAWLNLQLALRVEANKRRSTGTRRQVRYAVQLSHTPVPIVLVYLKSQPGSMSLWYCYGIHRSSIYTDYRPYQLCSCAPGSLNPGFTGLSRCIFPCPKSYRPSVLAVSPLITCIDPTGKV